VFGSIAGAGALGLGGAADGFLLSKSGLISREVSLGGIHIIIIIIIALASFTLVYPCPLTGV